MWTGHQCERLADDVDENSADSGHSVGNDGVTGSSSASRLAESR